MNTPIERTRIFSHLTRTRFLHIEDTLERGKLRFFIGSFEKGKGATSVAFAFLDVDDARVILSDMSWGKQIDFADYKGGRGGDDRVVSRVLKIKTRDDRVWIEVQNGVGEELAEGAVKPKGKPLAEISVPLTSFESRKLAFACLAYMQAWDVANLVQKKLDTSPFQER